MPNLRKPLSGQLSIRVLAVKDVDHAPLSRFSRAPETFVTVKVEDNVVARTRASRNDRWEAEFHNIFVDKANEVELTVYDKPSEHALPIGLLWVRISDISEELRRKRIEAETNSTGWVSADRLGATPRLPPPQFPMGTQSPQFAGPPTSPGHQHGAGHAPQPPGHAPVVSQPIDAWFNLEPTGQIQLSLNFVKESKELRPMDAGLNRKGAVRQRKEEVHEMYGHKFVQRQFYNIMRCALCGDFLKYSAGMQCEDCKYTCHTKCYTSVVTKCISKSNAESDPDEEKINHRIPHRFQPFSNLTANWCCHCGYMLPIGSKKNSRKCGGMYCHLYRLFFSMDRTNFATRMWSDCPRTMRPPCSRFLWHAYVRGKPDSGRHQVDKEDSPGKAIVHERADAESRQQRNHGQHPAECYFPAIFERTPTCIS